MTSWLSGLRRNIKSVVLVGVGSTFTAFNFALPNPILISEESFTNPLYSCVLQKINHVDIPNETLCIFLSIFALHLRKYYLFYPNNCVINIVHK